MGMQAFSKKEALGFGWKTMKENLFFFIILFIVLFLLYIIPDILADMVTSDCKVFTFGHNAACCSCGFIMDYFYGSDQNFPEIL